MPQAAEARGMPPPHYPIHNNYLYNNHKYNYSFHNNLIYDYENIQNRSLVSIGTVLAYTSAKTKQNRALVSI